MTHKLQTVVVKDRFGVYPQGCTKSIPCGMEFLSKEWIATVNEFDNDCPEKLLVSIGQEVEANHPGAIQVIKMKDPITGDVYWLQENFDDYTYLCECCQDSNVNAVIKSTFDGNLLEKPASTIIDLTIGYDGLPTSCRNSNTIRRIYFGFTTSPGTLTIPFYLIETETGFFPLKKEFANFKEYLIGKNNGQGGVWVISGATGANTNISLLADATVRFYTELVTDCGTSVSSTVQFKAPLERVTIMLHGFLARNADIPDTLATPFGSGQGPTNFSQLTTRRDFFCHHCTQCGRNVAAVLSAVTFNGNLLHNRGQNNADLLWNLKQNYEFWKPFLLAGFTGRNPQLIVLDVLYSTGNGCGVADPNAMYSYMGISFDFKGGDTLTTNYYDGYTYNDGINNIWRNADENNNGSFSNNFRNGFDNLSQWPLPAFTTTALKHQIIIPETALGWV